MSEAKQDGATAQDAPLLGAMPPEEALAALLEMGDPRAAELGAEVETEIAALEGGPDTFGGGSASLLDKLKDVFGKVYDTTMAVGFLPPMAPGAGPQALKHAGQIAAEPGLRNQRITIRLDRLRVADFPGGGMHHVLFDFRARNQTVDGPVEDVHFSTTSRVKEGQQAPVTGYPIFVGLRVGEDGVGFAGFTVNVKNEGDEQFMALLESDAFRSGLALAETVQPAIKPLSAMAVGMATALANRSKNKKVQEFYIGLDFTSIATGARLAQGSYVVVQIPESLGVVWRWSDWVYDPDSGYIVSKADPTQTIPYNYIVFSVAKHGA